MKKGQKVKICDGSYMTTVIDGKISHRGAYDSTRVIGWCKEPFTIVELNGRYPVDNKFTKRSKLNNCIIQNDVNGEVWFCDSSINIIPYKEVDKDCLIEHDGVKYSENTIRSILDKFTNK